MKFSLSWLKEHLETGATLAEITDKLTKIGLEVEGVEDKAKALLPFTIAHVVSAEKHPEADRLRVCMVDPGDGKLLQVVCGAPNARAGMNAVLARPGTHIPGTNIDLKAGTIRGLASNGMLLSAREMGLSDEHDGIVEVPAGAPLGQPYAIWAGLDDPVIETAVTPNRPDCLGVEGVARDLAAAGLGKLIADPERDVATRGHSPVAVKLDFAEGQSLCPAFALRAMRGVKNGPSPEWLQSRLRSVGLRPINALVDITNFLTIDRSRPLHVFDAAKVKGDLVVRRARNGEILAALDGKTYTLDETMVVIADDNGVQSLGGIMGGAATGVTEATTEILIESALWAPLNIAATGRKLGIHSDARHRFERGVDPTFTVPGLDLATEMALELVGGQPTDIRVAGAVPTPDTVIAFPTSEVKRLAGIEVPVAEIATILRKLGFTGISDAPHHTIYAVVPSWRPDIEGKADLVEEVIRIRGLDSIPAVPLPRVPSVSKPVLTLGQTRTRRAKRALANRGLVEAVTWSFVSPAQAETFGGGASELTLANPISADLAVMRPSLLPGLIAAAQRNASRGYSDLAMFEVGQVYRGAKPEDQFTAATGIRSGSARVAGTGRHWSGKAGSVSAEDAKADALALLDTLGVQPERLQIVAGGPAWFHPGRSGTIELKPKTVVGWFGEIHPKVRASLGFDGPLVGFELILESLPAPKAKPTKTKPALDLSAFQPVKRDFAFVVDRAVEAARLVRAAEAADRKLVTGVNVFDVFEGEAIGAGKKSVAIEVTIQPREKTLTDAEIEAIAAKVVAEVTKATGATLRS